jgi:hypothetical protein
MLRFCPGAACSVNFSQCLLQHIRNLRIILDEEYMQCVNHPSPVLT